MKIKCEKCSCNQEVTLDALLFDDKDEKDFVSYLAAEMEKSENNPAE